MPTAARCLTGKAIISLLVLGGSNLSEAAFCPAFGRQIPSLRSPSYCSKSFQKRSNILSASVSNSEEPRPNKSILRREDDDEGESIETVPEAVPLSPSLTSKKSAAATSSSSKLTRKSKRKMDLMWCTSEFCKDVVRERVVGDHNQIVLNGPATGQVAYQWDRQAKSEERHGMKLPTTASVLLLVKPSDELYKIAANAVKQLTELEIEVLLVPELAAKLKHYHGVDDGRISLFDPPPEDGLQRSKRISMENEGVWFGESFADGLTPFPDLVCTLGGDGLLMHASMMFQGACPPMLSIAGGSLGFLTPFSPHEMVDAIRIALGLVQGQRSKGTTALNGMPDDSSSSSSALNYNNKLEVFPPNMPSYPYEPLVKAPHVRDSTPKFSFGFGESICLSIRMRLDCRIVSREGSVKARFNVLNEVVIDRGSSPYLAALECFCDDVHLTTVQADGVIIATPTGSTAYSMAAGGSVVHPAVPCILVTPICPHVLSFRSMIFPDHVVLRCYVPEDARSPASVAFDGKHRHELQRGDSVQIQMSTYPVPTINRGDHSSDWLESLKRSFNFNTRPRQRPL